jgi:hypothetical protein
MEQEQNKYLTVLLNILNGHLMASTLSLMQIPVKVSK